MGTVFLILKIVLHFLKDFGVKLIKRGLKYYKFGFEKSIVFPDEKVVGNSKSQNCRCTDDSLAHTPFKEDLGWT